jgi:hypothetical protein
MNALKIKEIPVTGSKHPKVPNPILPSHEFTLGVIAPKGQGKTTIIINMIMFYKGYFNRILILSPTTKNDEKWEWLKQQNVLAENKKLKEIVKKIRNKEEKQAKVVQDRPIQLTDADLIGQTKINEKSFDPKIAEEDFIRDYDQEWVHTFRKEQQNIVDLLEAHGYSKHCADRILLICDDMVGSDLYSNAQGNPFLMLNANHRHLSTSIIMVTQKYTAIAQGVRTNYTGIIILKIWSEKEKETIQEELQMDCHRKQWHEIYDYCTKERFGFLYFNREMDPGKRIMRNFEEIVYCN